MLPKRVIKQLIPVALATGIFVSCSNEIEEIRALTEDRDVAVQTVLNGTFHYTEKGQLVNVLEAAVLDRYEGENPRVEVSGGFTLTSFDSLSAESGKLKAEKGTFWDNENRLWARENVILTGEDGSTLHTEELFFVQDSNLVYTDKHVKITTEDGEIFGKGLISDRSFKKRQIKQVTGTFLVEDPADTTKQDGSNNPN